MMKKMNIYLILSVFLLFALSIFLFLNNKEGREYLSQPPSRIGNYLANYFFNLGECICEGKDFYIEKSDNEFISLLPNELPYNYDDIREKFIENNVNHEFFDSVRNTTTCIDACNAWEIRNENGKNFWLIMKPLAQSILDVAFEKSNLNKKVNNPVIHFRCSDVPMSRHNVYYFQKYEYFKMALEKTTKECNNKNVTIVYCGDHECDAENKRVCNIYNKSLSEYLTSFNYNVNVQCQSIQEDFATLYFAPLVISTGGSFSFMAGFLGKGVFVSPGLEGTSDELNMQLKDWVIPKKNLLHDDVPDYYNTDDVIKRLSD